MGCISWLDVLPHYLVVQYEILRIFVPAKKKTEKANTLHDISAFLQRRPGETTAKNTTYLSDSRSVGDVGSAPGKA